MVACNLKAVGLKTGVDAFAPLAGKFENGAMRLFRGYKFQLLWFVGLSLLVPFAEGGVRRKRNPISQDCTFTLGWGHTGEAKDYFDANKNRNVITQGCYVGKTGGGIFAGASIEQPGPNGSWFENLQNQQSNGGFSPFDLGRIKETHWSGGRDELMKSNNLHGFMRMTQVHTIQMASAAYLAVSEGRCPKARIEFKCLAETSAWGDLDQMELDTRIAVGLPAAGAATENWDRRLRPMAEVLTDISQVCGRELVCLSDSQGATKMGSFPKTCGESFDIGPTDKMNRKCAECLAWILDYQDSPEFTAVLRKHLGPRSTWEFLVNDNWVSEAPAASSSEATSASHPVDSWRSLRYY